MRKKMTITLDIDQVSIVLEALDVRFRQAMDDRGYWQKQRAEYRQAGGRGFEPGWPAVVDKSLAFYDHQADLAVQAKREIDQAWQAGSLVKAGQDV